MILNKHRIEALIDGVFAIAMTLLILEIKVPVLSDDMDPWELFLYLAHLWPKFLSFVMSFAVLGIYYISHHQQFHFIHRADRNLLLINILFLMSISVLPFSAALLGEYTAIQLAAILYGLNLIAIGLISYAHWRYVCSRGHVTHEGAVGRLSRQLGRRALIAPAACVLAIALSFFNTSAAIALYLILLAGFLLPDRVPKAAPTEPFPQHEQARSL